MPRVIENDDGTKTFTVNSGELRVVKDYIEQQVPEFKSAMRTLNENWVRKSVDFIKSVIN